MKTTIILVSFLIYISAVYADPYTQTVGRSEYQQRILSNKEEGNSDFERIGSFSNNNRYKNLSRNIGRLYIIHKGVSSNGQKTGSESTCTGFIVSERHVLTAYHCISDINDSSKYVSEIHFFVDDTDRELGNGIHHSLDPIAVDYSKELDFALLVRNDEDTFDVLDPLILSYDLPQRREELFILHHPFGQEMSLTRRTCRVNGTVVKNQGKYAIIMHRCHTEFGSSGAPIFSDNTPEQGILGIHSNFFYIDGDFESVSNRAFSFYGMKNTCDASGHIYNQDRISSICDLLIKKP